MVQELWPGCWVNGAWVLPPALLIRAKGNNIRASIFFFNARFSIRCLMLLIGGVVPALAPGASPGTAAEVDAAECLMANTGGARVSFGGPVRAGAWEEKTF